MQHNMYYATMLGLFLNRREFDRLAFIRDVIASVDFGIEP